MFEKEAEETVDKSTWLFPQSKKLAKDFWQKGAEFGFQKGIKTRINTTTLSDCPIKDEWHKEQLDKAKEIIGKLVEGIRIISDPKVCMTDVDAFVSEAEQFLKGD